MFHSDLYDGAVFIVDLAVNTVIDENTKQWCMFYSYLFFYRCHRTINFVKKEM